LAAAQQKIQAMTQEMQQAQQAVMAEIEKLKQENEQLKVKGDADLMRAKTDENKARGAYENETKKLEQDQQKLDQDERLLRLKEDEYATKPPPVSSQETWEYDRMIARDKMNFEAEEKTKDRKMELVKTVISKGDIAPGIVDDDTISDALAEAADAVSIPVVLSAQRREIEAAERQDYQRNTSQLLEAMTSGLAELTDRVSAPRVLVRDAKGNSVGSRLAQREDE
jgi:hypothetical protein